MRILLRVSIYRMGNQSESTRYLTFLKGRVGRKVADFFMDFLGASEGLNAKAQNRGLLQALMISLPEAQLDKAGDRTCAGSYSYLVMSSCRQARSNWSRCQKELAGVSEVVSRSLRLKKATNWKKASRQTVAHCVS